MISVSGNIWEEIKYNKQLSQKIKQDYKFRNFILNYKKEINILCKFNLYGANNNKISTHIIDIVT